MMHAIPPCCILLSSDLGLPESTFCKSCPAVIQWCRNLGGCGALPTSTAVGLHIAAKLQSFHQLRPMHSLLPFAYVAPVTVDAALLAFTRAAAAAAAAAPAPASMLLMTWPCLLQGPALMLAH